MSIVGSIMLAENFLGFLTIYCVVMHNGVTFCASLHMLIGATMLLIMTFISGKEEMEEYQSEIITSIYGIVLLCLIFLIPKPIFPTELAVFQLTLTRPVDLFYIGSVLLSVFELYITYRTLRNTLGEEASSLLDF